MSLPLPSNPEYQRAFRKLARTFHQNGFHDPPAGDVARVHYGATTNGQPCTVQGRKNLDTGLTEEPIQAMHVQDDLWCYWRPRPPLTEKEKEEARRAYREQKGVVASAVREHLAPAGGA